MRCVSARTGAEASISLMSGISAICFACFDHLTTLSIGVHLGELATNVVAFVTFDTVPMRRLCPEYDTAPKTAAAGQM